MTSLRVNLPLALVAAALLSASCQVIYGLDDFETGAPQGDPPAQGGGGGADGGAGGADGGSGGSAGCACVDAAPDGWDGPYYVHSSSGVAPVVECSNGEPVIEQLMASPPTTACSNCQCTPTAACTLPTVIRHTGSYSCNASSPVDVSNDFADGGCHLISQYSLIMTVAPAPGSCMASGGAEMKTDWGEAHAVCPPIPAEGECGAGKTCLEPPGGATRVCVVTTGVATCPPGWQEKIPTYRNPQPDTRTCTQCTCGAMTGVDCTNAFGLHVSGVNCNNGYATPQAGNCVNLNGTDYSGKMHPPPAGQCPPGGGAVDGPYMPGDDATMCCKSAL